MEKNLVSIITPLFNAAKYISGTIDSVLAQSYQNWELIIIDDCSTDNGLEIAKSYALQENRIKVLQNDSNIGSGASRNKGIEIAQGTFIAFLDSDDQWTENKLTEQIGFMEKNNIAFSFAYYQHIDESGRIIKKMDKFPAKVSYKDTLKSNKIGCLTAMYNVKTLGKIYMPSIRRRQDYALWLRILKKAKYGYCVSKVLGSYTIRKGSISSNKIKLIKYNWIVLRKLEQQPFIKSLYYISYHIGYKLYDALFG